jgi:SHAQKYF class myb-like DNA-binding protein
MTSIMSTATTQFVAAPVTTISTLANESAPVDLGEASNMSVPFSVPQFPVVDPQPGPMASAPPAEAALSSRGTKSKKKKASSALAASASQSGSLGENTGRWTAEEHRLFLQGLEQHGKGWKKIASLIKSRTVVQIRTHAQKYFQKLAKARQNGEEGDVTMEGRGCAASITSSGSNIEAQTNKRRRQVSGTKRKAIQSVVASAQRQAKKLVEVQSASGVSPSQMQPLLSISPALKYFVLPGTAVEVGTTADAVFEESMYVYLK